MFLALAAVVCQFVFAGVYDAAVVTFAADVGMGLTFASLAAISAPLLVAAGAVLTLVRARVGGTLVLFGGTILLIRLGVTPASLAALVLAGMAGVLALIAHTENDARRGEHLTAFALVLPFVVVYAVIFYYPTYRMFALSLTDAKLVGGGDWVGFQNYVKLASDRLFKASVWNTAYFVILTVIPNTIVSLLIAMIVTRLKGYLQSLVLAAFFLPFILPVTVVYLIWLWVFDVQYGIAQYLFEIVPGERVPVFRSIPWFLPIVGFVTIWWTAGFNILVYIAGLRAISSEIYESASLDGASRWQQFRRITWPLIWPVTALVLTIQLILQLKIFDQVYLFSYGGRTDATMVMVQYVYKRAFIQNQGGYGAAVATALFLVIVVFSVLQYQALRARGEK
jgi:multiple sugar transport system permease protein